MKNSFSEKSASVCESQTEGNGFVHRQRNEQNPDFSAEMSPNTELFSDAGMGPSGECWVVPTEDFLRIWESPAGTYIKNRGFHMRNDGKQLGASQDCVLIVQLGRKERT